MTEPKEQVVINGFINVNKPTEMTSHDAVAIIRKRLPRKTKVGHTGTLDPQATGVLPICIGKGTRLSEYVQDLKKTYVGEITFGLATTTLDIWGEVTKRENTDNVNIDSIKQVLPNFMGEIFQVPPMVSAIKVNGQKLYDLARQGIEVERKSRKVHIYELELLDYWEENDEGNNGENNLVKKASMKVTCSSGTYIRTLFNDIGEALGSLACMSKLERVEVGGFNIENSISIEELKERLEQNDYSMVLGYDFAISHLEKAICDDARIINGLPVRTKLETGKLYRIYNSQDEFIGLGEAMFMSGEKVPREGIYLKMAKVIY